MKLNSSLRLSALLATASLMATAAGYDQKVVSIWNTTGGNVSDLHVTFNGAGGNVTVSPSSVYAGTAPTPLVPSNGMLTNTVVLDWGAPVIKPWTWVTFTVRTNNGPLNVRTGMWTLNNLNVGGLRPQGIRVDNPVNPPPPLDLWVTKWGIKIIPRKRVIHSPWVWPHLGLGWQRWHIWPHGVLLGRNVRIFFDNRNARFLEIKRGKRLVPILNRGIVPPINKWQRVAIRPPEMNDPWNIPINGPVRESPPRGVNWGDLIPPRMHIRSSDDRGDNERIGHDMVESFFDIYYELSVTDTGMPPIDSFQQTLAAMGPRYMMAAARMDPMLQEIEGVLMAEPGASVGVILPILQTMRMSMEQMGLDMMDGNVDMPWAVSQLSGSLFALGDTMPLLDPMDPRWGRVSGVLMGMARGVQVSANYAGINTTEARNYYLWGLQNRFTSDLLTLGHACSPHLEFDLDLGQHGWEPSEIAGAQVMVLDAGTGRVLDESTLPVTHDGKLFVPTFGYEDIPTLDVRIKFDTYLGRRILIPTEHPVPIPVPLLNGDVNGDEAINQEDIMRIQQDYFIGGPSADVIPPSDLNADGLVDIGDLVIAAPNLGQMGESFFDVTGQVALQDFVGDLMEEELQVSDPTGVSDEPRLSIIAQNGEFSIAVPEPMTPLTLKGRMWLSASTVAAVGPGLKFIWNPSLMNGDADNDNEVGPNDFSRLSESFGHTWPDSFFDIFTDYDGDGETGPSDFDILARNFGQSGS